MKNELKIKQSGSARVVESEDSFKIYYEDELELLVEYDYILRKWKLVCFDKNVPIGGLLDYSLEQKNVVIGEVLERYENAVSSALEWFPLKRCYTWIVSLLFLFLAIKLLFFNASVSFVCDVGSLVLCFSLVLMSVYSFLKTRAFGCIFSAFLWSALTVLYLKMILSGITL